PIVHGEGLQSRDFTYIDDVVAANLAAASAPAERCAGNIYNVAPGTASTLLDILDVLGALLGVDVAPVYAEPRAGDVRRSLADAGAAARDLGVECTIDLRAGLARTVAWLRTLT
ncbi:MAG TPA: NAD-dependent epimerase/dehydratase family protein, partial [Acidimicrobiia bacterium]|nr:NAD-dependent epimerase/dehydratase family protein [Acidimicrobiia bacterium]